MITTVRPIGRLAALIAFGALAVACSQPDAIIVAESQPTVIPGDATDELAAGVDEANDPPLRNLNAAAEINEAFARHLRVHGPLPSTVDPSPLSDDEAACTADRFTGDHADLVEAERIDEATDVGLWFDGPAGTAAREAFNSSVVACLSDATRARHEATVIDGLDYQRFALADDDVRCITETALRTGSLADLWPEPPATSFIFELATDNRDNLDDARAVWADALISGLDGCLGLGRLVAVDLGNVGVNITPRTAVCMDAAATGVSIVDGWLAGQTLDQISDPVMSDILACLNDAERAQLLEGAG